jgi:hypothetical protein
MPTPVAEQAYDHLTSNARSLVRAGVVEGWEDTTFQEKRTSLP